LGEDVFKRAAKISDQKADRLITPLRGYSELIKAYGVESTGQLLPAHEDASNGVQIINARKTEAGITVDIIDGKK